MASPYRHSGRCISSAGLLSSNNQGCEPALNIDQGFRASCMPKQQVAVPAGVQSARRFTVIDIVPTRPQFLKALVSGPASVTSELSPHLV